MSLTVSFLEKELSITFSGKERFLSIKKTITVPYETIDSINRSTAEKPNFWSKIYGTALGNFQYGYFKENGRKYFLALSGVKPCLHVSLKNHSYDELFLEIDNLDQVLSTLNKKLNNQA